MYKPIRSCSTKYPILIFPMLSMLAGGVRTTIAKHDGQYSKSDHLCQDGVE